MIGIEVGQIWSGRFGAISVTRVDAFRERVWFDDHKGQPWNLGFASFEASFRLVPASFASVSARSLGEAVAQHSELGRAIQAAHPYRFCSLCKAPASRLREGRCVYCDFATAGGTQSRQECDRTVEADTFEMCANEDARARLDAALRSERVPLTATDRQLALPHPW